MNTGGETVNLLLAFVSVPDAHVEAGHFMAHICVSQYRYGADHTRQPENAKCLFEFDGARYNYVTNPDPLNVMSQVVTKKVVNAFHSKLSERLECVRKKLDDADDDEATGAEASEEDGEASEEDEEGEVDPADDDGEASEEDEEGELDPADKADDADASDEDKDPEKLRAEETLLRTLLLPRLELMSRKLSSATYLNAVQPFMRMLMYADTFYAGLGKARTKEFCDKLDADQYLIGCNNGVFNVHHTGWETGASFMFHSRGDGGARLVSMSTQYDFTGKPDGTPATPEQETIIEKLRTQIFDKIFFEKGMNETARLMIGGCFFGNSTIKKMFFLLGAPNGGKSLLIFLMKVVFGDYFGSMSPNKLTESKNERDPDAPQPVWVQAWKKRVIVLNEGDKNRVLDRREVCEKTGGDSFTMRGLHGRYVGMEHDVQGLERLV